MKNVLRMESIMMDMFWGIRKVLHLRAIQTYKKP